ncbi:hypothetical protein Goshw_004203 [Gossypium schwendimanii]|uniref:Glutaredoxin domain-containing protein n=15 Tax=Gossypium TaxID=3633 RepID=A0A7J9L0Z3_GOSSC|nr:hypothetical protein [Gossypium schwendimanii]
MQTPLCMQTSRALLANPHYETYVHPTGRAHVWVADARVSGCLPTFLLYLMDRVRELASKKAAVIFTKSSCCMCYSIKTLFYELGASPAIHELDQDPYGRDMERALRALGCDPSVPAVFIGGRFVGSSKDVISLHVDGSLKQMLKDAKAIWF